VKKPETGEDWLGLAVMFLVCLLVGGILVQVFLMLVPHVGGE
jgi:hypothetical protein